jgi:hypothetical protein
MTLSWFIKKFPNQKKTKYSSKWRLAGSVMEMRSSRKVYFLGCSIPEFQAMKLLG